MHAAPPARQARHPRDDPRSPHARARPGDGGGPLPGRLQRRTVRPGPAWRAAVAQGRRLSEPRRAGRDAGRRCASAAPHRDRGDRQPRQGRRRAGGAEHERDARARRDRGARMPGVRVVKVGGNELDRPAWVAECARALVAVAPLVVVHGGGQAVSALSPRLSPPVEKRDGLRVTTPEIAEVVEMVLGGPMNRLLVAALREAGLDAIGLSGVDGGLLAARPAAGGLGHVGEIAAVRASLLESLLLAGLTPVVAPVATSADAAGLPFNVNAHHAAAAVAAALHADELRFVSDIPGRQIDGVAQPTLAASEIETQISSSACNAAATDRKSTRLNSSHLGISYAVFCLEKKTNDKSNPPQVNLYDTKISPATNLDSSSNIPSCASR